MSRTPTPYPACPCGRTSAKGQPLSYTNCCGRFIAHFATQPAPDAQSLMRSRYSAFVRADAAYLLATWHPSTRPADLDFDPAAQWLGLQVKACASTGADSAEVEFIARYRLQGRAVRLHERSRFVRQAASADPAAEQTELPRWFYVDGEQF